MNNKSVERLLKDCKDEINKIKKIIDKDKFNSTNQYLTKYSLIKACGTIEQAFKSLIYDYSSAFGISQISNFVYKKVKESSMNPNYGNMITLLNQFDEEWSKKFKQMVKDENESNRIKDSLQSLNDARNQFAHGGNPTITIDDIIIYFNDTYVILHHYDNTISTNIETA